MTKAVKPNILVVCANPKAGSFCKSLARAVVLELKNSGHRVTYHDLDAEKFPPVIPAREIRRGAVPAGLIRRHCADLVRADGIVIIHPNWWGQPPAVMKGWIDRVFRTDVAYRFDEGDDGEGVPVGLLKARFAVVFNTSDTEKTRELKEFGDPLDTIWKNCVFALCGVRKVIRRTFGVIVTSSIKQRKAWIAEAVKIVRRCVKGLK